MRTTLRLWFERRGTKMGRRGVVGLSVLLILGLAVALTVVLIVRPGATVASARATSSATPATPATSVTPAQKQDPATLRAEAVLRGQAAAWIAQQVSPAAIVSCDPAMCSALQARGVPGAQLLVLQLADTDPLGSDVVVATPTVRSQFGARLTTVYAPEVIASFGSGALRIDVRAIAPSGAAAFESSLAADNAARINAGEQLLRNKRIAVSKGARAALGAGDVDPRLLIVLAGLGAQEPVSVLSFGDPSPGAPGVPLRAAGISVATQARLRTLVSFLRAQQTPYVPALTQTTGGHFTITIEYDAPGPLGMGGELMKIRTVTRRTLATVGLLVLGLGVAVAGTARASEGSPTATGWIRLAHLSPNTPAVDVYLYSFGNSDAMIVLHHVSYGTVSPYEQVAAGEYSVAMRAAGASASSAAVLSTSVDIAAGHAYTVAGMGPESGLRLAVLDDQLTTPSGQALVRVIEASLVQRVATVTFDGVTLARKLSFGSVSSYQAVAPATGDVAVTDGSGDASSQVSLKADTVHTLVVLDGTNGLEVVNLLDAAGNTSDPAGGVATGFGGTAAHGPSSPLPWLVAIAVGLCLAVTAGLRLRRLSRA